MNIAITGNPYENEKPCCGQVINNEKIKFCTKNETELDKLSTSRSFVNNTNNKYYQLPTIDNPIYITLYPRGEYIEEKIIKDDNSQYDTGKTLKEDKKIYKAKTKTENINVQIILSIFCNYNKQSLSKNSFP